MTLTMQVYLTVLLGLIVNFILSRAVYKITEDSVGDFVEGVIMWWALISTVLPIIYVVYLVLALIWHWY